MCTTNLMFSSSKFYSTLLLSLWLFSGLPNLSDSQQMMYTGNDDVMLKNNGNNVKSEVDGNICRLDLFLRMYLTHIYT
jgi:hypothetical protein